MGDRIIMDAKCVYCNELNEEVWYAPTCESYTFRCEKCGKENFICDDFMIKKIEDVTLDDIKNAFFMATSQDWDEKTINKMCKETLKQLKRNR